MALHRTPVDELEVTNVSLNVHTDENTMKTGPIELNEIIAALASLGGQARAISIKDRVTKLRGGVPSQYASLRTYQETIQAMIERYCPQSKNCRKSTKPYFERISRGVYKLMDTEHFPPEQSSVTSLGIQVAEDLAALQEEDGIEGAKQMRLVAHFERIPRLRVAAIALHGTRCKACGFDFEATYGEHGVNYIEVHHLVPLASLPDPTSIDPKIDLTVLCSNCHRMIHRKRGAPLTIDQLVTFLASACMQRLSSQRLSSKAASVSKPRSMPSAAR